MKEAISEIAKYPSSVSVNGNLNGSRSVPKLGILQRQKSDGKGSIRMPRNIKNGELSADDQHPGYDKRLMTIFQNVEASRRESLAFSDLNNESQLSREVESEGMNEHRTLPFQRIRASKFQSSNYEGFTSDNILQNCGICSRRLLHRSPWSSQRFVVSTDLPIVSVLCCGHVFHADCLEKSIPDVLKRDPPCPVCEVIESETHSKAFLLNKLDGMKGAMEPFRNKLAKTFNLKSTSSSMMKVYNGMKNTSCSLSGNDKKFLGKSLSKLQFHRVKSMKDSCNIQYPGPSRVSPDQI